MDQMQRHKAEDSAYFWWQCISVWFNFGPIMLYYTVIVDDSTRSVSKIFQFHSRHLSLFSRCVVYNFGQILPYLTDRALSYRHVVPSPVNNQNRNVNTVRHNVNNVSTFFPIHHTITNISAGKIIFRFFFVLTLNYCKHPFLQSKT